MTTPLIQLDGALTPRQQARRLRRSTLKWLAISTIAAGLLVLQVAINAGAM